MTNMAPGRVSWFLVASVVLLGCALIFLNGKSRTDVQADEPKPAKEFTAEAEEKAAMAEGQALYRGLCSGCHGGLGHGGKVLG